MNQGKDILLLPRPGRILCLVALFFWALGLQAFGQNTSVDGNFEVDNISGCAPFTVTPNTLFPGSTGSTLYFYDNTLDPLACSEDYRTNTGACVNGSLTAATEFTYTVPGTYYLVQILGTTPNPTADFIEITVTEPVQPAVDVAICTNNEVILTFDFSADPYDFYEINFGEGLPSTTFDKTGPNTITNPYMAPGTYSISIMGRLNSGDDSSCALVSTTVTTIETIAAPEISQVLVVNEDAVEFFYETLQENVNYAIYVNLGSGFNQVATVNRQSNNTSFTIVDNSFDFTAEPIQIQMSALNPCDGTEELSEIVPTVVVSRQLVYDGDQLISIRTWRTLDVNFQDIAMTTDRVEQMSFNTIEGEVRIPLESCTDDQDFEFIARFNTGGPFGRPTPSQSITIRNDGSSPVGPVLANHNVALALGGLEVVYSEAPVRVSRYVIYRQNASGNFEQVATTSQLSYTDSNFTTIDGEVCYRVSYIDECGVESVLTDEACIDVTNIARVPNAFSPNGDDSNDFFTVTPGIYANFRMQIFNRWGALVFVTTDAVVGWDGNINGQPAPTGGYVYRITFNDPTNTPVNLTGTLVLIR